MNNVWVFTDLEMVLDRVLGSIAEQFQPDFERYVTYPHQILPTVATPRKRVILLLIVVRMRTSGFLYLRDFFS